MRSCVSKQQELAALLADAQLIVQLGSHREGLVSLGRKLIALKRLLKAQTLGELTVALSGKCSLDPRESKCVYLDALPNQKAL